MATMAYIVVGIIYKNQKSMMVIERCVTVTLNFWIEL